MLPALLQSTIPTQEDQEEKTVENRKFEIPEMLTIKEVAARTGMSYDTIRNFCLEHKVVYIKTGWKYLINWQSVLDYFNHGETDEK